MSQLQLIFIGIFMLNILLYLLIHHEAGTLPFCQKKNIHFKIGCLILLIRDVIPLSPCMI